MIELSCEYCDTNYRVAEQFAGRKTRCRRCSEVLAIPLPKDAARIALRRRANGRTRRPTRRNTTTRGLRRARARRRRGPSPFAVACLSVAAMSLVAILGGFVAGGADTVLVWIGSLSFLASLILFLMIVVLAFGDSVAQGLLSLFVPFYAIYYGFARMRHGDRVLVTLLYLGLPIVGVALYAAAACVAMANQAATGEIMETLRGLEGL